MNNLRPARFRPRRGSVAMTAGLLRDRRRNNASPPRLPAVARQHRHQQQHPGDATRRRSRPGLSLQRSLICGHGMMPCGETSPRSAASSCEPVRRCPLRHLAGGFDDVRLGAAVDEQHARRAQSASDPESRERDRPAVFKLSRPAARATRVGRIPSFDRPMESSLTNAGASSGPPRGVWAPKPAHMYTTAQWPRARANASALRTSSS
jgi:hypothetical protein